MKRIALGALAVLLLAFGLRWLVHALASDETRIRWRLEQMRDGFNETEMDEVLIGLAADFREDTSGADKPLVHQALLAAFLQEIDASSKRFALQLELDAQAWELALEPGEPASARATGELELYSTRKGERRLLWKSAVEADLVEHPSWGWQLRRARCRDLAGRPRLR